MRNFKLTFARDKHSKNWQQKEVPLDDFLNLFRGHEERDSKDGICFVSATLLDGKRNLKSVEQVDCLVYDIDGAQSLEDVRAIITDADLTAVIYTTYSHKSTRTQVLTDHYEKWAKQAKAPTTPNPEFIKLYLAAKGKGHLKNIVFDDMKGWERIADVGNCYVIDHDPVDKIRVILPLDKPIVIAKLGSTNAKCNDAYKAIYHGVGQHFGLEFDPACSDPTRLFYFPSCPVGKGGIAFHAEYDGPFLQWEKIDRATVTTKKAMETIADGATGIDKPTKTEDYLLHDDGNGNLHSKPARIDLWGWMYKHSFDFDIEGLLENVMPDQILAPRPNGGFTITCPFESEHSDVGGMGTFASNEDGGERAWTIYCSHASCQSEKRKRLDFIKEWIKQGYVHARDLYTDDEREEMERSQAAEEFQNATEENDIEAGILAPPDSLSQAEEEEAEEVAVPIAPEVRADPVKFAAEIIDRLKKCNYEDALRKTMREAVDGGFSVTPDMLVEFLSGDDARISIKGIKSVLKKFFEDESIPERVLAARTEAEPYENAISHIIDMSYSGLRLEQELRKLGGWYGQAPIAVRADYKRQLRDSRLQTLDKKLRDYYPKMTAQYAKLIRGSKIEIIDEENTRKTGELITLGVDALHLLLSNECVDIQDRDLKGNIVTKNVQVSKHWLRQDTEIRVYGNVTFDPGQTTPKTSEGKYNLWNGWPVKGIPGREAEVEKYVVSHIRDVWCEGNEELVQWVLMYFADIVQRPWNKPHSAICLLGDEGSGKSIIFDCGFSPIFKTMYVATSKREHLVGKFNKQAEGKLLWLAEESLFSGDKRATDDLKDLISRDKMGVEPKGKDIYEVPNRVRYVFTSNRTHPLDLNALDRRFLVLSTSNIYRQNTEYHSGLKAWFLDKGGAACWLDYLQKWTFNEKNKAYFSDWKGDAHGQSCSGWNQLFKPPMTKHKAQQQDMSRPAPEEFFVELLKHGRIHSVPADMFNEISSTFSWPFEIEKTTDNTTATYKYVGGMTQIRRMYEIYLRHHSGSARYERNYFNRLWDKYMGAEGTDYAPNLKAGVHDPVAKKTRGAIGFQARKHLLREASARHLMTAADYTWAGEPENSLSHVSNELAEKDHR